MTAAIIAYSGKSSPSVRASARAISAAAAARVASCRAGSTLPRVMRHSS